MDPAIHRPQVHLLTVRVWAEDLGDGRSEWRGQVSHPDSGQTRYFRDWPGLADVIAGMVQRAANAPLLPED